MTIDTSMTGKVCLVTGATNGIGEVTAHELANRGATVVIASRSEPRCAATVAKIKNATGNANVSYFVVDLSSQASIHQFVKAFLSEQNKLHVLVNNAGMLFINKTKSVDGIEMTFALDHLGYFLLTNLLLDTIKASAPARIINVASDVHRAGRINLADPQAVTGLAAYNQAKLANVLFTYELARRLQGTGVTVNALHPGVVASGFGANNGFLGKNILRPVMNLFSISPEKGAETSVYLATSPEVATVTGKYFDKKQPIASSKLSYDEQLQHQLWDLSERMTGLVHA